MASIISHRLPVLPLRSAARLASRAYASEVLKKTALYDFHVKHGGKMVPFAGYSMPVQYSGLGVLASHLHTREGASIFDVSHMLQTRLIGKDRNRFFETLVVADLENLPVGHATLSVFTNERGGIIDDTVIMQQHDSLYVVSNAGCADKDLAHIHAHLKKFQDQGGDVEFNVIADHSSTKCISNRPPVPLPKPGPKAAQALQTLVGQDLTDFKFMTGSLLKLNGVECHVARSGYTGEDGFEISVPTPEIVFITEALLRYPGVEMAGLGARDSLRLEAGLCLYGHDLDDTITPVEAGLTWTIAKRRRQSGGFLGSSIILPQIKDGVTRRRVGLIVEGAPAREGAEILTPDGNRVGTVTSGGPSPSLKKNIAMGYVADGQHKLGTPLVVKVRGKDQSARVVKMPFVEAKYYK
ncbi:hypothetical protein BC936DRAFT_147284 [Jimgerdemannia flammicorona]|uniref:Aminomethyltransferase n=1 Tax=Jimgerdemannia flammicorona TaxID=994334 RepID=A0A433D5M5_9FUNG|nr:hypothetical protein BC936DRAFT_147284 [Jimgerdemannia flammicorona]